MGVVFARSSFDPNRLARKSKTDILYEHNAILRALGRPELTFEEKRLQSAKTNVVMAHDVARLMRDLPAPPSRLKVGSRVDRDDGRFYIPIYQDTRIVCRVASDAFTGPDIYEIEKKAKAFAESMADAYNLVVAG